MSPYPTQVPEPPRHRRFVTLCQQLLALAVVVAVLTPAARTVTMDVRPSQPMDVVPGDMSLRSAHFPSTVPTKPVRTDVHEYALTAPAGHLRARVALRATARAVRGGGRAITSDAIPVGGYGTVGVTWAHGESVPSDRLKVQVRTKSSGRWSGWTKAPYDDEHAPDPRSAEGRHARPGTDAVLVGDVDKVQVKVATTAATPDDMKLAVIDPGKQVATARQRPAIDTGRMVTRTSAAGAVPAADTTTPGTTTTGTTGTGSDPATTSTGGDDLALQAGAYTPRPMIYSRAQWGANEKLRDKSSLHYFEVHGGFVHHTVNANNYSAADVPAIIRGIYSYHVRSKGWSDIGYNFLVDRFGRIWEGRAGGVDRPVVGAHTENYNQYSFAMSAIGNYDKAKPSSAMLNAYGVLFAWKLAIHGVYAGAPAVQIGRKVLPAISGHRDTKSTACPGKYLYAQLPTIRKLAAQGQRSFAGRELTQNYLASSGNDLLARRISDGHVIAIGLRQKGSKWTSTKTDTGIVATGASQLIKAGDWDRDGFNDFISRRASDGVLFLYRGIGGGKFQAPRILSTKLAKVGLLTSPGDVTGDGFPDLMGQPAGQGMRIYPGKGGAGLGIKKHNLARSYAAYSAVQGSAQIPAGLMDGDGALDSLVRSGRTVRLYRGNGPGGWSSSTTLDSSARGYDWLLGISRIGTDRQPDFFARSRKTGNAWILPGTTSGWTTGISLGSFAGYDLAA
ncbi:MAG TPA: N-acetylmuramoyl-L-alanine amidase [Nocardioides sp.]|nr:N-acetylmuramoyl-L-alanine amidase [Nocardioides sp.]